ncbi:serine-rich adhesin for platelets isoform X3 [Hydra vulgaris]
MGGKYSVIKDLTRDDHIHTNSYRSNYEYQPNTRYDDGRSSVTEETYSLSDTSEVIKENPDDYVFAPPDYDGMYLSPDYMLDGEDIKNASVVSELQHAESHTVHYENVNFHQNINDFKENRHSQVVDVEVHLPNLFRKKSANLYETVPIDPTTAENKEINSNFSLLVSPYIDENKLAVDLDLMNSETCSFVEESNLESQCNVVEESNLESHEVISDSLLQTRHGTNDNCTLFTTFPSEEVHKKTTSEPKLSNGVSLQPSISKTHENNEQTVTPATSNNSSQSEIVEDKSLPVKEETNIENNEKFVDNLVKPSSLETDITCSPSTLSQSHKPEVLPTSVISLAHETTTSELKLPDDVSLQSLFSETHENNEQTVTPVATNNSSQSEFVEDKSLPVKEETNIENDEKFVGNLVKPSSLETEITCSLSTLSHSREQEVLPTLSVISLSHETPISEPKLSNDVSLQSLSSETHKNNVLTVTPAATNNSSQIETVEDKSLPVKEETNTENDEKFVDSLVQPSLLETDITCSASTLSQSHKPEVLPTSVISLAHETTTSELKLPDDVSLQSLSSETHENNEQTVTPVATNNSSQSEFVEDKSLPVKEETNIENDEKFVGNLVKPSSLETEITCSPSTLSHSREQEVLPTLSVISLSEPKLSNDVSLQSLSSETHKNNVLTVTPAATNNSSQIETVEDKSLPVKEETNTENDEKFVDSLVQPSLLETDITCSASTLSQSHEPDVLPPLSVLSLSHEPTISEPKLSNNVSLQSLSSETHENNEETVTPAATNNSSQSEIVEDKLLPVKEETILENDEKFVGNLVKPSSLETEITCSPSTLSHSREQEVLPTLSVISLSEPKLSNDVSLQSLSSETHKNNVLTVTPAATNNSSQIETVEDKSLPVKEETNTENDEKFVDSLVQPSLLETDITCSASTLSQSHEPDVLPPLSVLSLSHEPTISEPKLSNNVSLQSLSSETHENNEETVTPAATNNSSQSEIVEDKLLPVKEETILENDEKFVGNLVKPSSLETEITCSPSTLSHSREQEVLPTLSVISLSHETTISEPKLSNDVSLQSLSSETHKNNVLTVTPAATNNSSQIETVEEKSLPVKEETNTENDEKFVDNLVQPSLLETDITCSASSLSQSHEPDVLPPLSVSLSHEPTILEPKLSNDVSLQSLSSETHKNNVLTVTPAATNNSSQSEIGEDKSETSVKEESNVVNHEKNVENLVEPGSLETEITCSPSTLSHSHELEVLPTSSVISFAHELTTSKPKLSNNVSLQSLSSETHENNEQTVTPAATNNSSQSEFVEDKSLSVKEETNTENDEKFVDNLVQPSLLETDITCSASTLSQSHEPDVLPTSSIISLAHETTASELKLPDDVSLQTLSSETHENNEQTVTPASTNNSSQSEIVEDKSLPVKEETNTENNENFLDNLVRPSLLETDITCSASTLSQSHEPDVLPTSNVISLAHETTTSEPKLFNDISLQSSSNETHENNEQTIIPATTNNSSQSEIVEDKSEKLSVKEVSDVVNREKNVDNLVESSSLETNINCSPSTLSHSHELEVLPTSSVISPAHETISESKLADDVSFQSSSSETHENDEQTVTPATTSSSSQSEIFEDKSETLPVKEESNLENH